MTVRVLISDKMDPKAAAIFRERGIEVDEKAGLNPDELKAIIGLPALVRRKILGSGRSGV